MISRFEVKNNDFMQSYYDYRKKELKKHELKALFFEVTSRCNARCEHCGSRCDAKEQGKEISADDISKLNPRDIIQVKLKEISSTPYKKLISTVLRLNTQKYELCLAKMVR